VAAFYLDTSALVKRYAVEPGTRWVVNLTDPGAGHLLYTVRLTGVEMVAALYRKVRTGEVRAGQAQRADADFLLDWVQQYEIVEVTDALVMRAMRVARLYPLRGYDALQLAAALEVDVLVRSIGFPRLTLVSADRDLLAAAAAERLSIDDPNNYP
jgi:predicted nucleic acid-binding protein